MTTSALPSAPAAADEPAARPYPTVDAGLARRVLGHALLLGVAGQALLGRPWPGLAVPLWVGLAALALVSLTWAAGRDVPAPARRWLAAALLFSAAIAWRDAEELVLLDFAATVFALGMAAVALREPDAGLLARRMRDSVHAFAGVVRAAVTGIVPLALRELLDRAARDHRRTTLGRVLRAAAIASAVLLVFGSLLRGADPIFASMVRVPDLDVGELVGDVFVIGFFTWTAGGWALGALTEPAVRPAPRPPRVTLGRLELTAALGTVVVLFAAFVLAQLGWLFGGEAFLRERTGMTAAAYARGGFFQMVLVVALVLPLLLATRAALGPDRALARRHTTLALPVVGLLVLMILSAVGRMRLYVHYYGLTIDRLYPLVFMAWLGVVLAWLALTVLRGHGRPFVAGAVLSGLATLGALNVAAPDRIVARVNVARASRPVTGDEPTLDVDHLSRLGGEATDLVIAAVLAPSLGANGSSLREHSDAGRCKAANRLLERWSAAPYDADGEFDAAWRYWNAGDARARRLVLAHAAELRRARAAACPRVVRRAAEAPSDAAAAESSTEP